jgi:hypothetical protein
MKRPNEELLNDLLEDSASSEFRASLLDRTLHQVRRRKQMRRLTAAAGIGTVAMAMLVPITFWRNLNQPVTASDPAPGKLTIVQSTPLNPSQIVSTRPDSAWITGTSTSTVAVVETAVSGRNYIEIDDQQLLALAADRPVALVRHAPGQSELILLNAEDRNGITIP